MQTNPYPIVAIDIAKSEPIQTHNCACTCAHGNEKRVGACICNDCKCHLRKRQNQSYDYIQIPIPSHHIQCFGYGIIVAIVTIVAVYMLLQPKY